MPKGVANKRYTPEFKKLVIETMWVTDVTEFSLFGEKLYLSPILDLHSSDAVSADAPREGYPAEHEPQGKLPGQCCDRKFLRFTQK